MPTVVVNRKGGEAESLAVAVEEQMQTIVAGWDAAFTPYLRADEVLPDARAMQELVVRAILAEARVLEEADKANVLERSGDTRPRLKVKRARANVRRKMIEVGDLCRGLYGRELATELVVTENGVARRSRMLLKQADHTLDRLRAPEFELPELNLDGVEITPAELASSLEPYVEELRRAIDEVDREVRRAALTQTAKDRAMASYQATYSAGLQFLKGLYRLVGRQDLAERLAPRRRRRSGSNDNEEEQEQEEQEEQEASSETAAEPADGDSPMAA